jgi:hypothetical protein
MLGRAIPNDGWGHTLHLSRVSVRFKRRRKAVSSLSLFTLRLSRSHYMYMQPNKRMPATATLSHTHAHAHRRHAVTYVTVTRPMRIRNPFQAAQSFPTKIPFLGQAVGRENGCH